MLKSSLKHLLLIVYLSLKTNKGKNHGRITSFKLVLHGTYDQPEYLKNGPRIYEEITSNDPSADEKNISNNNKKKYLTSSEESESYEQETDNLSDDSINSLFDKLLGIRE